MEQVNQQVNIDQVIKGFSGLSLQEIDLAMQKLIEIRKQKLPSVLTFEESELLKKINRQIPEEINSRYLYLKGRRNRELLTEKEHSELLELINYLEQINVDRLEQLVKLAKIRNITLNRLVESLELNPMLDAGE